MIVLTSLMKFTDTKRQIKDTSTTSIITLYTACLRIIDTSITMIINNDCLIKMLLFKIRVLRVLADAHRDDNNYDNAISNANISIELSHQHFKDKYDIIADSLTCKAIILSEHCEYDDAIVLHKEALDNRRKLFGNNHDLVASSLHYIAMILIVSGDYNEAKKYSDDCLSIRLSKHPADSPVVASSLFLQARLMYLTGHYDEALG